MSDEQKQRYRDKQKKYRDNMSDEQKQKNKEANKRYRDNMSDEQKQRYKDYQKKCRDNMTDKQKQKRREANKRYKANMTDEQKQKLKDYQIDYQKKYYAAKKLNKKFINDNDFYCISIIIKLKNIIPMKDINSVLKINKKAYPQAYLEDCNFIDDSNIND